MDSAARQTRIADLIRSKLTQKANLQKAKSDLATKVYELEAHRSNIISNRLQGNQKDILLEMFNRNKLTGEITTLNGLISQITDRIYHIQLAIDELNREEERYTEAIRIAEERRLAELERIRYQAEWDKTPLYIKPINNFDFL